jgi:hypothetical protein
MSGRSIARLASDTANQYRLPILMTYRITMLLFCAAHSRLQGGDNDNGFDGGGRINDVDLVSPQDVGVLSGAQSRFQTISFSLHMCSSA